MSHGQACYDVFIYIKISAPRWSQTYFLRYLDESLLRSNPFERPAQISTNFKNASALHLKPLKKLTLEGPFRRFPQDGSPKLCQNSCL